MSLYTYMYVCIYIYMYTYIYIYINRHLNTYTLAIIDKIVISHMIVVVITFKYLYHHLEVHRILNIQADSHFRHIFYLLQDDYICIAPSQYFRDDVAGLEHCSVEEST